MSSVGSATSTFWPSFCGTNKLPSSSRTSSLTRNLSTIRSRFRKRTWCARILLKAEFRQSTEPSQIGKASRWHKFTTPARFNKLRVLWRMLFFANCLMQVWTWRIVLCPQSQMAKPSRHRYLRRASGRTSLLLIWAATCTQSSWTAKKLMICRSRKRGSCSRWRKIALSFTNSASQASTCTQSTTRTISTYRRWSLGTGTNQCRTWTNRDRISHWSKSNSTRFLTSQTMGMPTVVTS